MITDGRVTAASSADAERLEGSSVRSSQPSLLSELWQFWKAYAHRASGYQSTILLTLVYYLVLGPSATIARMTGKQLLPRTVGQAPTYWVERAPAEKTLAALERQF